MKRIITVLLILLLVMSLAACGGKDVPAEKPDSTESTDSNITDADTEVSSTEGKDVSDDEDIADNTGSASASYSTWEEAYNAGRDQYLNGEFDAAIESFNAAIELDEMQPDTYSNLAYTYMMLEDTEKAIEVLEGASALIPGNEAITVLLRSLRLSLIDTTSLVTHVFYQKPETLSSDVPSFTIPQFSDAVTNSESLNEELLSFFTEEADNFYSNSFNSDSMLPYSLTYGWAVNDCILSLVIEYNNSGVEAWCEHIVYNIDILKGVILARDEFLHFFHLSEYNTDAAAALEQWWYINHGFETDGSDVPDSIRPLANTTISEERIEMSLPYFNESGDLCAVCYVSTPAGRGNYWRNINLYTYESVYYESVTE